MCMEPHRVLPIMSYLCAKDAEAQREQVTLPGPHSWLVVTLAFQVRQSETRL